MPTYSMEYSLLIKRGKKQLNGTGDERQRQQYYTHINVKFKLCVKPYPSSEGISLNLPIF
jgi:hypothetical protein